MNDTFDVWKRALQKEKKKKTPPDKDDIEQRKAAKERKRKLRELVEHDQELGLYDDYLPH